MIPDSNEISNSQSKSTIYKRLATDMLLDYAHTYPNAKIRHHTSNMIMHAGSDAAYLFMPEDHSRINGHYYLRDHTNKPANPSYVKLNGPIITKCNTLGHVVGSTS